MADANGSRSTTACYDVTLSAVEALRLCTGPYINALLTSTLTSLSLLAAYVSRRQTGRDGRRELFLLL